MSSQSTISLTLSTPSGKTVTATLGDRLGDRPYFDRIVVEGKPVGGANGEVYPPKPGDPPGVAGFLAATGDGVGISNVRIALDAESAEKARAAVASLTAEIEARPEVRMERLVSERKLLSRLLVGAQEDWADRRAAAWESGDEAGAFVGADAAAADGAVGKAKADLAAFDADHPEVVAEVKRRADERRERFLRYD